jgi:hypothetical protein
MNRLICRVMMLIVLLSVYLIGCARVNFSEFEIEVPASLQGQIAVSPSTSAHIHAAYKNQVTGNYKYDDFSCWVEGSLQTSPVYTIAHYVVDKDRGQIVGISHYDNYFTVTIRYGNRNVRATHKDDWTFGLVSTNLESCSFSAIKTQGYEYFDIVLISESKREIESYYVWEVTSTYQLVPNEERIAIQ